MNTLEFVLQKFGIASYSWHTTPIEVPNFGRDDLAMTFAELGFTSGVEIGVDRGKYSETLCKANPKLRLISIDPWHVSSYGLKVTGVPKMQAEFDAKYQEAKARLAPYHCDVIRARSLYAVDDYLDNTFDFVYIDGNHEFQNCVNDICEWSKKVRPGGIISGHDYAYYPQRAQIHVKQVVSAYTRAYGIIPWFVLGVEAAHQPGVTRDESRSWLWVKRDE